MQRVSVDIYIYKGKVYIMMITCKEKQSSKNEHDMLTVISRCITSLSG